MYSIKIDNTSDFISPSQGCVVALNTNPPQKQLGDGEVHIQKKKAPVEVEPVKISLHDCLACSGCVTSAETVLLEQQSAQEFLRVLENASREQTCVVVTISSQSRTSLAGYYGLTPLDTMQKLSALFKGLGAHLVIEDNLGRDLALLETLEEFGQRYTAGNKRPLLTSECPGWVCYAEKSHGQTVLPYMSKTRSAVAILGSLVKKVLPQKLGIPLNKVYHCFISPCYDKKLEASREEFKSNDFADIDCVLATTELQQMMDSKAIIFPQIPGAPFDDMLGENQGQQHGVRGSSGGYLEFVFREAAYKLTGQRFPPGGLPLKSVRGTDFQEIDICDSNGNVLACFAVAYGFRNIQNIIRRIKQGRMKYDFVEIMACPSGCLNGGGQIKGGPDVERKEILAELEELYHHRQIAERDPRHDPGVNEVISLLGGRDSPFASSVLRTEYHDRVQKVDTTMTPATMNW